jgi:hypothetical protein
MIKKTIRYFLKYGLIKTLTRSFLEIRRMLDGNSELPNVANNTPVITSESNSAVVSKESEKIHTYQSREGASINILSKQNGILYIDTLHTYPLHERPWDFWRFSGEAWKFLLNKWTGFEIIYSTLESPCKIVPETEIPSWLADHEAYLYSKVLARKISHYDKDRCKWEIKIMDVFESNYPRPH